MKRNFRRLTFFVALAMLAGLVSMGGVRTVVADTTCTPTGFIRDGIDLTAAVINPVIVLDEVDATGCNIGVYYSSGTTSSVEHADIHGANYFGIVNDGATVSIGNSEIHDIGETPPNGSQHGVGIYFAADTMATGTITNTYVWNYQKGGIAINGGQATIEGNVVTGQGPIDYIAQNGIQVAYGATATLRDNTISGNDYTPTSYVSCGVLYYQADGVRSSRNTLFDNERDVCNFGRGGGQYNPEP